MPNLNTLETFRTKEELLNYFEEIGKNITEEEIENLKKSYEQAQENNSALSLQQLDNVAGGEVRVIASRTKINDPHYTRITNRRNPEFGKKVTIDIETDVGVEDAAKLGIPLEEQQYWFYITCDGSSNLGKINFGYISLENKIFNYENRDELIEKNPVASLAFYKFIGDNDHPDIQYKTEVHNPDTVALGNLGNFLYIGRYILGFI